MPDSDPTQRINSNSTPDDSLRLWLDAFLTDRQAVGLAPGSLRFYRQKLEAFWNYANSQGVIYVHQVTPGSLRAFLIAQAVAHSPGGVHTFYRSVKAFLLWWEGELEPANFHNPIHKVKPPKVGLDPLAPVELSTVEALASVCPRGSLAGERDRSIFLSLLDTGARASEFLSMDLADLNPATGEILIRQGKGHKPREVYLSSKTRKYVRAYLRLRDDQHPAIWINMLRERLRYDGLRAIVTRRAADAHIEPPELHAFRRAFALNMLRAGVDVYSLQKLMGHASLQVLLRYLALDKEDTAAAHVKGSPVDRLRL